MGQTHKLKTLPNYWDAIKRGDKNFEVRRDDRGFQRGDTVVLEKYCPRDGYAWRDPRGHAMTITRQITYVLTGGQFGIEAGFVVLGLNASAHADSPSSGVNSKPDAIPADPQSKRGG